MTTRYVYNPEIKEIFLYKGTPVIINDPSYGHVFITDLKDSLIDCPEQYDDDVQEALNKRIGRIIKPRWDKEIQIWQTVRRGLTRNERNLHR